MTEPAVIKYDLQGSAGDRLGCHLGGDRSSDLFGSLTTSQMISVAGRRKWASAEAAG